MNLLYFLLIGIAAGWLGSVIMKGSGLGLIGNLIVGVVGSFIGGWLLGELGFSVGTGLVANLITATIGAVVLLFIVIARSLL